MSEAETKWVSEDGSVTLFCGDCLSILPTLPPVDVLCTDPPYGINYSSGMTGHDGGTALRGIEGDADTSLRDAVLRWWGNRPAIVFGTWKRERPAGVKAVLIWEKGDHVGMGDLSMPWKPNTEEIYVLGSGFAGHRGSSVLKYNAPVTWNSSTFGRTHPHEKPVELMEDLLGKCPGDTVGDFFMGSGSTGVAAVRLGKGFVGCEVDPEHFQTAKRRIQAELKSRKDSLFDPVPYRQTQREMFAEASA